MLISPKCNAKTVSCPAHSAKTVVSFGFMNAARFFSALRFYFYRGYAARVRV